MQAAWATLVQPPPPPHPHLISFPPSPSPIPSWTVGPPPPVYSSTTSITTVSPLPSAAPTVQTVFSGIPAVGTTYGGADDPLSASTNLVQSPLEMMDALPTVTEPPLLPTPTAATDTSVPPPLPCTPSPQPMVWLEPPPTEAAGTIEADVAAFIHSDRQRLGDEQQPMSMDGLPALHPNLQKVDDKQQATSWAAPQPADQSELLLPPALPIGQTLPIGKTLPIGQMLPIGRMLPIGQKLPIGQTPDRATGPVLISYLK
jgi:hypothetical protein